MSEDPGIGLHATESPRVSTDIAVVPLLASSSPSPTPGASPPQPPPQPPSQQQQQQQAVVAPAQQQSDAALRTFSQTQQDLVEQVIRSANERKLGSSASGTIGGAKVLRFADVSAAPVGQRPAVSTAPVGQRPAVFILGGSGAAGSTTSVRPQLQQQHAGGADVDVKRASGGFGKPLFGGDGLALGRKPSAKDEVKYGGERVMHAIARTFSEKSSEFNKMLALRKRQLKSDRSDWLMALQEKRKQTLTLTPAELSKLLAKRQAQPHTTLNPEEEKVMAAAAARIAAQLKSSKQQHKPVPLHDEDEQVAGQKKKPAPTKKTEITINEHMKTVEELEAMYHMKVDQGLSSKDAVAKMLQDGPNELTPPPSTPLWKLFMHHLFGFFSLLLWLAGFLCLVVYLLDRSQSSNLYLAVILVVVVILTAVFSFYQDTKSAAVMAGFKNFLPPQSLVVRDGDTIEIPARDIVVGDVVKVKFGEKVPADLRLIEAQNFKVDNSPLTGESLPVKRGPDNQDENPLEASNLAFYGALAVEGSATGIVIRTGDNTVIGTIANIASTTSKGRTTLSLEIEHLTWVISVMSVGIGIFFGIINFIKGASALQNAIVVIGIIIANVPQGLLATVTVALTVTAMRMTAKKVLVKNLEAVETLGSCSVIASDKTGTLTMNRMTAAHVWYNNHIAACHGADKAAAYDEDDPTFQKLMTVGILCNNAMFLDSTQAEKGVNVLQWKSKGDASETAFIKFFQPITPIAEFRTRHPKLIEIPFNSANKFQVSIHKQDDDWNRPRLLVMKGAPERIWARCSNILIDGQLVPVDQMNLAFEQAAETLMGKGERVLACCMTELDPHAFPEDFEYNLDEPNFPLAGLTFVGLVSLVDPPRPAVPSAVLSCREAGIQVIMVTGDHPDTAEAIAKQVNIIRGKTRRELAKERGMPIDEVPQFDPEITSMVVTGSQLLEMDAQDLDHVLDYNEIVFARTSPKQKLEIVTGLQNKREKRDVKTGLVIASNFRNVVAVTGDGVNDSPALKKADIGVAMGIVGSDVAKDAADMVLLNDNFASIVDGVEEGRLIFSNLRKSIAYVVTHLVPELVPFLANILVSVPVPLSVFLLLSIDLGTDVLPGVSLAYEGSESNIMKKPPRNMLTDRLVTPPLIWSSYLRLGLIESAACMYTFVVVMWDYGFHPANLPNNQNIFDSNNDSSLVFADANGNPIPESVLKTTADLSTWKTVTYNGVTIPMYPCNIPTHGVCQIPSEALAEAQTAVFLSIVVMQWFNLLASKTRELSLKSQGMGNMQINYGIIWALTIAVILIYVPPLHVLGARPLRFEHWLPSVPWGVALFMFEETRKWLARNLEPVGNNWLVRNMSW